MSHHNTTNEKKIEQLPRWARVAFAARCTRRVQPLFSELWPRVPKHIKAVTKAVDIVEKTAALGYSSEINYVEFEEMADEAATDAGYAGVFISKEVACAAAEAIASIYDTSGNSCFETLQHALKAANGINDENRKLKITNGIYQDLDHLLELAQVNQWDDETPVSSDFFGSIGKE